MSDEAESWTNFTESKNVKDAGENGTQLFFLQLS